MITRSTVFANCPNDSIQRLLSGHPTSNPCRFDVDITSIRQRLKFDKFQRHFHLLFWSNFPDRKIHVVSTYFSWCNFDGRKIHVISTYFFRYNFDGRKIHVVSTYFYQCNFAGRKIHVASTYFFRCNFDSRKIYIVSTNFFRSNFSGRNSHVISTYFFRGNFDGQKSDIVFDNLWANENIRGSFPVFVTLNSWLLQVCSL